MVAQQRGGEERRGEATSKMQQGWRCRERERERERGESNPRPKEGEGEGEGGESVSSISPPHGCSAAAAEKGNQVRRKNGGAEKRVE